MPNKHPWSFIMPPLSHSCYLSYLIAIQHSFIIYSPILTYTRSPCCSTTTGES
ncbi:hypothetical protein DFQ01_11741 [Paenibacillus cellulosilyticus]|uniref:Uncharacterized protein n=1 Tax=Paenibacillus cellulosilyticus TaxID=375489 RepID=A0A2V2YTD5_9BACL|nr:hypothetical protein DFQ01_11741 [Paenibacillus cellulosilyticus]